MKEIIERCKALSDEDLTRELQFVAEREKRDLALLLAHLAEYDRRRIPQKNGHESTFMFCLRVLHYDEGGAYRRVHAARVVRRFPDVLKLIADGSLTLTSLLLLSPILNENNHGALFREATGKTKREVEMIVAAHDPRPPQPDSLRRLPGAPHWTVVSGPASVGAVPVGAPSAGELSPQEAEVLPTPADFTGVLPSEPPKEWQAIMPLSLERIRIGFDAAVSVMTLINRARQILRHKYPEGRLEDVMKEALEVLLDRKDPQRRLTLKPASLARAAATPPLPPLSQPRWLRVLKAGRYVPAWVKRAVWERDGGRCAWRFDDGTLCGSKDWLEYDHVRPFAKGGRSDSPRNVRLLCRLHNSLEAEKAGLASPRGGSVSAGR